MKRILHVSDIHFGPHYLPSVGQSVLQFAGELQPPLIIVSGDFTQRAKREQYAAAREWLDQLPAVPTIVVPGNHDVPLYRFWERMLAPYRLYGEYIHRELDYVVRTEHADIVALNSSTPYRAVVNGVFRRNQLEQCQQWFADTPPEKLRFVVAHHPLIPPADYRGAKVAQRCREAALTFARLRVDAIFSGHFHRAFVADLRAAAEECLHEFPTLCIYSGTSTSARGRASERGRNSLNVVDIDRQQYRIERYYHQPDKSSFQQDSTFTIQRPHPS